MPKLERTIERRSYHVPPLKRASWGAIFGGAFVVLAIMTLLGALGVAIGATTIDPAEANGSPSPKVLTIGAVIWWMLSGIVALFAGGWVTGRLSGLRRRFEGTLHGVVMWALYTAVALVIATSVIGAMLSGAMRVVGAGASVAAKGAGAAVSGVTGGDAPDVAWDRVWGEAQRTLEQTRSPELKRGARAGARDLQEDLRRADVESALSNLFRHARTTISEADKQDAVNVLVARTDMSRQEARKMVDNWSNTMQSAWKQMGDTTEQVQQAGIKAADAVASAIAAAGWWTFLYLLLTGIAAAVGGMLGAPRTSAPIPPSREEGITEEGIVVPPTAG